MKLQPDRDLGGPLTWVLYVIVGSFVLQLAAWVVFTGNPEAQSGISKLLLGHLTFFGVVFTAKAALANRKDRNGNGRVGDRDD